MSLELWLKDPLRYRRVHRKLLQFFYGRGCREAEDLIQETYLHVLSIERQGKIVVHSDQIFLARISHRLCSTKPHIAVVVG